uniref:Aminopeptidase n=1 Tax=Panagrolaimus sp. JU765 TaxID=591449 RepID=A0AC34RJ69_9BILA
MFPLLIFLLFLLLPHDGTAFECYGDGMQPQYCSAVSQYCLKAVAYNGQVYRGCSYVQDCPQGPSCAPITYGDGNTDYVCCCIGDLCNTASDNRAIFALVTIPVFYLLNNLISVLGHAPLYRKRSVFDDNPGPRLPHNVDVHLYEIEIQPFIEAEGVEIPPERLMTFDGKTKIFFTIKSDGIEPSYEKLTLDAKDLEIKNFAVYRKSEKIDANISFNEEEKKLSIEPVNYRFEEKQKYRIDFEYTGKIRNYRELGFFHSQYINSDNNVVTLYGTQFESVMASTVFPNFDDPHFKANFSLTLIHPASLVTLSNTNEKSSAMRVWAWKGVENFLEKAVTAAENCFSAMLELTGVAQPLEKLDHVVLPQFAAGGMENWGLIIYNAGYSLLNPLEPELSNELGINEVFCHEIAHQWFGDLVTTDWWSNIVLNEGFAAFFETEAAIKGFPSQSGPFLDSAHILSTYISYSTARSHPIVSNGTHFDAVVYKEGSLIWRMMDQLLPDGAFRRALTHYLNKYAYSTTVYSDLANEINKEIADLDYKDWCGQKFSAKTFLDYWLTQINYPVLNVDIGFASDRKSMVYLLSQNDGGKKSSDQSWPIPLKPLGGDSKYSWLAPKGSCEDFSTTESLEVPFESDMVFNYKSSFFGKVNYSDAAFDLLYKMWSVEMPCGINFLKLMKDEASFQRTHRAVNLAVLILKNADVKCSSSIVFTTAVRFLAEGFMQNEYMPDYIQELITPTYRKFANWKQTTGFLDWDERNLQRTLLPTAVFLDIDDAREQAYNYYKMLMNDSNCNGDTDFIACNPIPFDYRSAAYCAAVKIDGGKAENFLSSILGKLRKSGHLHEADNIDNGLRCAKQHSSFFKQFFKSSRVTHDFHDLDKSETDDFQLF